MEYESFVYKWVYHPTGEYYIGIHKGTTDDGYIGSGTNFLRKRRRTSPKSWTREILYKGTDKDCSDLEAKLINKETLLDEKCLNICGGGRVMTEGGKRKDVWKPNRTSYRTKPQEIYVYGVKYNTRISACQALHIGFEQLDEILTKTNAHQYSRYNDYNRQ